jgi:hypothetical protein
MLQMTGLGDVTALGALNKMRVAAKLENLDSNNARMPGTATHGTGAEGGHVSGPDGSTTQVGSVAPNKIAQGFTKAELAKFSEAARRLA